MMAIQMMAMAVRRIAMSKMAGLAVRQENPVLRAMSKMSVVMGSLLKVKIAMMAIKRMAMVVRAIVISKKAGHAVNQGSLVQRGGAILQMDVEMEL